MSGTPNQTAVDAAKATSAEDHERQMADLRAHYADAAGVDHELVRQRDEWKARAMFWKKRAELDEARGKLRAAPSCGVLTGPLYEKVGRLEAECDRMANAMAEKGIVP